MEILPLSSSADSAWRRSDVVGRRPVFVSIAGRVVNPCDSSLWQRLVRSAGEEREGLLGYRRGMSDPGRRLAATLRRHPTAADAALAVVLATAAVGIAVATFELLQQDPAFEEPAKPGIFVAVLAVMLPLALRRRFPLTVAAVFIAAFVVGRLAVNPGIAALAAWEGTMTVWACWIALYSAVVHGRGQSARRSRSPCSRVLYGEVVRELFFYRAAAFGPPSTRPFCLPITRCPSPSRSCSASRSGGVGIASASLLRGRGSSRASGRRTRAVPCSRSESGSRASCTTSSPTTSASWACRPGRRAASWHSSRPGPRRSQLDRGLQPAGVLELHRLLGVLRRADEPDELTPQPDLAQLPELVAQAGGGLTVELSIEGEPRSLSRTLEVSVYRVIQEALTNAVSIRRHERHGASRLPAQRRSDRRARRRRRERSASGHRRRAWIDGHARAGRARRRAPARWPGSPWRVRGARDVPADGWHP